MSADPRQPTALEHARGVVAGWLTYAPKEEFPRAMAALDELDAEYGRENERLREALAIVAGRKQAPCRHCGHVHAHRRVATHPDKGIRESGGEMTWAADDGHFFSPRSFLDVAKDALAAVPEERE